MHTAPLYMYIGRPLDKDEEEEEGGEIGGLAISVFHCSSVFYLL